MNLESQHHCLIYDGPPSKKLRVIGSILQSKLNDGYRCLYLNSAPMVAGLRSVLASMGMDVASEIEKRRLVFSSEPVSKDKDFSPEEMLSELENSLDQALTDGYKGLWASGDMTWEFGPSNDFSKLLEYECSLEKLLQRRKELCGICQYHKNTLPVDALRQGILNHSCIVINETLKIVNPHYLKSTWPPDKITIHKLDEMIDILCELGNMEV